MVNAKEVSGSTDKCLFFFSESWQSWVDVALVDTFLCYNCGEFFGETTLFGEDRLGVDTPLEDENYDNTLQLFI